MNKNEVQLYVRQMSECSHLENWQSDKLSDNNSILSGKK